MSEIKRIIDDIERRSQRLSIQEEGGDPRVTLAELEKRGRKHEALLRGVQETSGDRTRALRAQYEAQAEHNRNEIKMYSRGGIPWGKAFVVGALASLLAFQNRDALIPSSTTTTRPPVTDTAGSADTADVKLGAGNPAKVTPLTDDAKVGIASIISVATGASGVRQQSESQSVPQGLPEPGTVVKKGPTNKNVISFTFDDLNDSTAGEKVLEILNKYEVKGTFFPTAKNAKANTDLLKRMVQQGHEIGIHSVNHDGYDAMTEDQIYQDIAESEALIRDALGDQNYTFQWARPPYGRAMDDPKLASAAKKAGVRVAGWSQDYNAQTNVQLDGTEQGGVVLCHMNGSYLDCTDSLSTAIQAAKTAGISPTTLSGMYERREKPVTSSIPTTLKDVIVGQTDFVPVSDTIPGKESPKDVCAGQNIEANTSIDISSYEVTAAQTISEQTIEEELRRCNSPFLTEEGFARRLIDQAKAAGIDPAFILAVSYIDNHYGTALRGGAIDASPDGDPDSIAYTNRNPGGLKPGRGGATEESRGHASFASYGDGIAAMCRLLTDGYIGEGRITIPDIMEKYAPNGVRMPEDAVTNNTPTIVSHIATKIAELQKMENSR